MLAQLLRNTSLYTISTLFTKGIGLLLLPVFTRLLSPTDYGALDLLTAFASLMNVVVALEISQGLARYWPAARTEPERRSCAATCLSFTVAAYLVFTLISAAVAPQLSELILGSRDWTPVLYLAIPTIALGGFFYLLQVQFSYELRPRPYVATSVTFTSLAAIISLILLLFYEIGLMAIFAGQLLALAVVSPIALYLLKGSFSGSIDLAKLRQMLAFSLPLVLSSVAYVLFIYVDRMVISQFLSLHDVGLFGMGQRVASIIALLVAGLQTALTPLIYYHHAEAGTPVLIARMFRAAWGLLLILALALGLFSVEIVTLIAPPNFAGGAIVVFPLGLSAVFANLYVFAPGPSIARRTWVTALINFAGLTSNALLSLLLTPVFGIVGASVATVTASAALLGAKFYFSQRFYPIPLAWGRICAALGVCVGTFLAGEALGLSAYVSVGFIAIKFLLLGICVLSIIGLLTKMEELRAFVGQVQSSATRGNL